MLEGVYQNAAAMTGLESWNNAIAQNLSQASAPGYKQTAVAFEGSDLGFRGFESALGQTKYSPAVGASATAALDFSAGAVRHTGDPLEFAIEGDGFFELRTPDGEFVLTRDGQFKVSKEGELVSKQGFRVMSETRTPIQLIPDGGELSAAVDGTLNQNGQRIGEIRMLDVDNTADLRRAPGGYTLWHGNEDSMTKSESNLRQGYLEGSNVSTTREMVNMINVSRSFQINQRMISSTDQLLGQAIKSLGGHA